MRVRRVRWWSVLRGVTLLRIIINKIIEGLTTIAKRKLRYPNASNRPIIGL
jgi:hypothetical protein